MSRADMDWYLARRAGRHRGEGSETWPLHVVATTVSIVRPAARCVYSECIGGSRTRRGRADGLLSPALEGRSSNDTATGYCARAGG